MSLPNVFKALSDPIRRDILMMLKKKGEMSAGDIASEFEDIVLWCMQFNEGAGKNDE